ncbi:MAG: transcription initiation protein [Nitrospirae bacterium]|nr:transcription initiation protein [Nitrospirota bacterium]
MQFLLIICHDDDFRPSERLFSDIKTWIEEMSSRGIRVYGNPLRPADDAITVRVRNGKLARTNAPFANSTEKMCAYELMECGSIEEAVEVASKHPMAKAATIEVRQVWNELAS